MTLVRKVAAAPVVKVKGFERDLKYWLGLEEKVHLYGQKGGRKPLM